MIAYFIYALIGVVVLWIVVRIIRHWWRKKNDFHEINYYRTWDKKNK